jgi:hypothetical protein
MTGFDASAPMLPSPRTADPDRDKVLPGRQGRCFQGVVHDGIAGRGNARRIGQRQIALIAQRFGRRDRQLSRLRMAVVMQRHLFERFVGHWPFLMPSVRLAYLTAGHFISQ